MFSSSSLIITENLTLHLDASNNTSWSGSDATWHDLSGHGADVASSNNPPRYNTDYPPHFTFKGGYQFFLGSQANVLGKKAYTKSLWVCFNQYDSNNLLSSFAGGHFMYMGPKTKKIYSGHRDWSSFLAFPSQREFKLHHWYFVALTFDDAEGMKLYVNGTLDSTYTANKSPRPGNGSVNLGTFLNEGTNCLCGRISQVYCYDRALTDAEILHNFTMTKNWFRGQLDL